MKHLFIINPAAGKYDKTGEFTQTIRSVCDKRCLAYEILVSRAPGDCTRIAHAAAATGDPVRIYACGGDGTLNECVCGAAGAPNVAVTHFPTGTGNDFIKCFGHEDSERFRDLDALINGEVRPLDIIDCNGRKSINICSVGIDARIGTDVHKYSSIPVIGGATGYVTSLFVNLAKGLTQPLRVICNGKLFYGDLLLVCICNGNHYGGGFNPVPEARPDDGLLDFLVVSKVSRVTFLKVVANYAKGKYADYPQYITHLRGSSMEIDSEKEIVVNIDGEAIHAKHVSLKLIPDGVNFIFPSNMAYFKTEAKENAEN